MFWGSAIEDAQEMVGLNFENLREKATMYLRGGSSSSLSYSFDVIVGDRVKKMPQALQDEMKGWKIREVTEQGNKNNRNLANPSPIKVKHRPFSLSPECVAQDANIMDIQDSLDWDAEVVA